MVSDYQSTLYSETGYIKNQSNDKDCPFFLNENNPLSLWLKLTLVAFTFIHCDFWEMNKNILFPKNSRLHSFGQLP